MGAIGQFIRQARRRRVFRVAALYVIAAWVILQLADILLPAWNIPETAKLYVVIGAISGFPLALTFSGYYDIASQGIVRTAPAQADIEIDLSLRRSDYLILPVFVPVASAATYALVNRVLETSTQQEDTTIEKSVSEKSIAILPFDNRSSDPENAYFADEIHDNPLL